VLWAFRKIPFYKFVMNKFFMLNMVMCIVELSCLQLLAREVVLMLRLASLLAKFVLFKCFILLSFTIFLMNARYPNLSFAAFKF